MGKIIEPSKEVRDSFIDFCKKNFKNKEFSTANAINLFMQDRYKTQDKWTDIKNLSGFLNRNPDLFRYTGQKPSKITGKNSKHYKVK